MVSPKRSLSPSDGSDTANTKRQKLESPTDTPVNSLPAHKDNADEVGDVRSVLDEMDEMAAVAALGPTRHSNARTGIQRAIALVLDHDGFASATPQAMESFTNMVETYIEDIIEETKRFSTAARRDYPVPTDYEAMLSRYNLPVSSLKPHIKNPISKDRIAPTYVDVMPFDEDAFTTLPLLSAELSGQVDKDGKPYIPSSFPDFPSRHTYKFTPQDNSRARDPKKIREEAARTAQQGEDALRRLVRASKMRKQKEAKLLVEGDSQGRERFRLWEMTMKRLMGAEAGGENADQIDIADHSMIVNGDALFSRREVSRLGKRTG